MQPIDLGADAAERADQRSGPDEPPWPHDNPVVGSVCAALSSCERRRRRPETGGGSLLAFAPEQNEQNLRSKCAGVISPAAGAQSRSPRRPGWIVQHDAAEVNINAGPCPRARSWETLPSQYRPGPRPGARRADAMIFAMQTAAAIVIGGGAVRRQHCLPPRAPRRRRGARRSARHGLADVRPGGWPHQQDGLDAGHGRAPARGLRGVRAFRVGARTRRRLPPVGQPQGGVHRARRSAAASRFRRRTRARNRGTVHLGTAKRTRSLRTSSLARPVRSATSRRTAGSIPPGLPWASRSVRASWVRACFLSRG